MLEQLPGHSFLMAAAEGEHHAPMASLKITMPGAAAFGFQKFFLSATERAQIGITGNDDLVLLEERFSRIRGGDLANEMPVSAVVGHRPGRIETGIYKELAGASSNDEAMVSIVRLWVAASINPFALRIEIIFPDQVVGVSERIFLEIEFTTVDNSRLRNTNAAAKKTEQDEEGGGAQSSSSALF